MSSLEDPYRPPSAAPPLRPRWFFVSSAQVRFLKGAYAFSALAFALFLLLGKVSTVLPRFRHDWIVFAAGGCSVIFLALMALSLPLVVSVWLWERKRASTALLALVGGWLSLGLLAFFAPTPPHAKRPTPRGRPLE